MMKYTESTRYEKLTCSFQKVRLKISHAIIFETEHEDLAAVDRRWDSGQWDISAGYNTQVWDSLGARAQRVEETRWVFYIPVMVCHL